MKKILFILFLACTLILLFLPSCTEAAVVDESDEIKSAQKNDMTENTLLTVSEPDLDYAETQTDTTDIAEITYDVNVTAEVTEIIETTESNESIDENQSIVENVELIPKDVPILMYHTSSESNPGGLAELYVKPSEFEKQVQYLIKAGYTFCTFDDYYNLNNIDKPIFLTFDDGYLENYTEIFPILQKYNAKITLFLILSSITPSNLTQEMIFEMSDSGYVKFESHTLTHPSLVQISGNDTRLTAELQDSKTKIEEITGKKVLAISYPNGEFNEVVKEKAKEIYLFGLRKDLNMHNTSYDTFEVRRIRINRSTSLENYKKLIEVSQ